jgi:hypothetical protein
MEPTPKVKQLQCEGDPSPPSSAAVNLHSPMCLYMNVLNYAYDNFIYLYFTYRYHEPDITCPVTVIINIKCEPNRIIAWPATLLFYVYKNITIIKVDHFFPGN